MTSIKKQSLLSTLYSYLGVGLGLLTQGFILPNYFETNQIGLMAILLSWMYLIAQFASLGFNHAGTKYFSFFRNSKPKNLGYLNLGIKTQTLGFLISLLLLWVFKDQIISNQSIQDKALLDRFFLLIFPITLSTMLFNLFDNYAKGLSNTVAGNLYSQFFQRLFTLLSAALYAFNWVDFDMFMYIWVLGLALPTIMMIYTSYQLGNMTFQANPAFFQSTIKKDFTVFAGFSVLTGLSSMIILQLDKIMVNSYLGLSSTGIYSTCLLFASVMGMGYLSVIKASSAVVINAMDENELGIVSVIYKKSSVNLYAFGLLTLLCTWINIDQLFGLVKPEYVVGKTALIIIGFSKLFDLLNGINGLILSNSKYYKLDSLLIISFVLVLFLLNKWLIPLYGINGAAFSALISVVYYNLARTILIWKYFQLHPFGWEQLISTLIFMGILWIGFQLPDLELKFLSICYKSILVTMLFSLLIYLSKSVPDFNSFINLGIQKLSKWL
ncbi:lipopolysaccharide biosynthesis protein [Aquirufa sp. ROCK2-A2]